MITKAVLLVCLLQLIIHAASQSVDKCWPHFRYVENEGTEEITGSIEIRGAPEGVPLQLSVAMSIAAALPTKYVGRIQLAQSKEQSIKAVQQGRPLKYNLYFPLRQPIPEVTSLWFNSQRICTGERVAGHIVTNIVLNHTLYPPGMVPLTVDDTNVIPTEPQRVPPETTVTVPITTSKPIVTTSQPKVTPNLKPPSEEQSKQYCGRNGNLVNPLIARGDSTMPGEWPWLAAIFLTNMNFTFQCAGTLVTNIHIITAAHCVQPNNEVVVPGVFLVSLGRYRLKEWREEGSVNREVANFTWHPDYKREDLQSADSDLAVVTLIQEVQFTAWIKPICLWSGPTSLSYVVNRTGFVVGWGSDNLGNTFIQEPRMIKTSIVAQDTCLWRNSEFTKFTTNRTFCAGSLDGSGPCNGDSGSGFVIYDAKSKRYYLRGVVSRSVRDKQQGICDLMQYIVYVDAAQYLDWIRQQIST